MAGADALDPLTPDAARRADTEHIGGKARGLLLLADADLPAPAWRVWTDTQCAALLALDDDDLTARLVSTGLGERVIFRSSGAREDHVGASAAGLYDSVVAERRADYAAAFRQVARSGSGAHVHAYHDSEEAAEAIPVIVQAFIEGDLSGVVFSGHPSRASTDAFYVECVAGRGAALVDGTRDPIRLDVPLDTPVASGSSPAHPIPADALAALRDAIFRLEPLLRSAVDCEWCIHAGRLWFLQARPITALHLDPGAAPEALHTSWFFDQRFPEPITPFTRDTLLRVVIRVALGDALRMRGVERPQPALHYYAGRAYASRRHYDDMLRGAPRWWLSEDLRQIFPPTGRPPGHALDTVHYAWCALRAVWRERRDVFFNLAEWDRFCTRLDRARAQTAAPSDWDSARTQWKAWDEWMIRFLRIHRWSILWADYAHRALLLVLARLPAAARERTLDRTYRAARLKTAEANAALARLPASPSPEERAAFVQQYGHRSGSLDYAEPTWAELLDEGRLPRGRQTHGDRPAPSRVRWPLNIFVRLMELREEQRFRWEQMLAEQRRLALHLADRCVADRLLPDRDAIWFCTCDDLDTLERAEPVDEARLRQRRHAHWLHRSVSPPQQIGGPQPDAPRHVETLLRGLGASPGQAEGTVLVCPHAEDIPPDVTGRILVIRALDPAWTARVQGCAGLVVERGGLLSHAAIIAREYRIPLVIGVDAATEALNDGQRVALDGYHGTVHCL